MENMFVGAMMRVGNAMDKQYGTGRGSSELAGCCAVRRHHARTRLRTSKSTTRLFHSTEREQRPVEAQSHPLPREEYMKFLDFYGSTRTAMLPMLFDSEPDKDHWRMSDDDGPSGRGAPSETPEQMAIRAFYSTLEDPTSPPDVVFAAYRALPPPRISLLGRATIRRLLRRLSVAERKNPTLMMQYLSVLDDVKAAEIPLTKSQWTSAIALAGRCFYRVTSAEVEAALRIFRAMEAQSGVRANQVTFNVLFDVATKAQKFVLAEMVMKEMQARGLELDRFGYVGLIYYYGVRGDGDGIRATYREFVDSGRIVDTAVLNCVIASLLKAGELPAAEQVYERMKIFHEEHSGAPLPPSQWWAARSLAKSLRRLDSDAEGDPEKRRIFQERSILAPDARTFLLLVQHHCLKTGQLNTVADLLQQMRAFTAPLHGSIFLVLLKGFSTHGGERYSDWTLLELDQVWAACINALEEGAEDVHLGRWMVLWALRAYHKCGGLNRMLELWEDIRPRWQPHARDLQVVETYIQTTLRNGQHRRRSKHPYPVI